MQKARVSRRDVLGVTAGALVVGTALAEPLKAAAPEPSAARPDPPSWVDPAMPEVRHRMIETNGIQIHIAERGTGPVVILCHGFPECWYSWRHQLQALAEAGFRAVAFDLRGYGRSGSPEGVEKYTLLHYIGDVVGLLDALGVKQAVIAGHDVGATVAWEAARLRPDRFRGIISLGVPFRPRVFGSSAPPTTVMPQNQDALFYQLYFQTSEAQAVLERDIRLTFRSFFYTLSGNAPRRAVADAPSFVGMVPRKTGPALTDPASLPGWITASEVDFYVGEFARSGFRGPLAWYRNIDRSWEFMAAFDGEAVTVPALYIAGDRDFLFAAFQQFIAKQWMLVPTLRPPIVLPHCGHWTQQERAPEVSAAMVDFLRKL
jgi:pimeloyl-ACP methyl ester carboxylesterase